MKRRTLDLLFIIGGVLIAGLLLVLGLVMRNNADFAKSYVHDQLSEQKITFTAADKLADAEKASPCLVKYAGTPLDSGKKAECYANEYIGLHLKEAATGAGYEGATYATLGAVQREVKGRLTAATTAGQPTDAIQKELDTVNTTRSTMFNGETLRGLLLTSYGFSVFGEKGDLAATVCFLAAAVLLLAAIAGLVHFVRTPADAIVLGVNTHTEAKTTAALAD